MRPSKKKSGRPGNSAGDIFDAAFENEEIGAK